MQRKTCVGCCGVGSSKGTNSEDFSWLLFSSLSSIGNGRDFRAMASRFKVDMLIDSSSFAFIFCVCSSLFVFHIVFISSLFIHFFPLQVCARKNVAIWRWFRPPRGRHVEWLFFFSAFSWLFSESPSLASEVWYGGFSERCWFFFLKKNLNTVDTDNSFLYNAFGVSFFLASQFFSSFSFHFASKKFKAFVGRRKNRFDSRNPREIVGESTWVAHESDASTRDWS